MDDTFVEEGDFDSDIEYGNQWLISEFSQEYNPGSEQMTAASEETTRQTRAPHIAPVPVPVPCPTRLDTLGRAAANVIITIVSIARPPRELTAPDPPPRCRYEKI
ncbi:hypothetical protein J6590_061654 [Homalodisca vitripennis]|nr:hypothetical protein J6590_061654 [Homalodisca vitripennis]